MNIKNELEKKEHLKNELLNNDELSKWFAQSFFIAIRYDSEMFYIYTDSKKILLINNIDVKNILDNDCIKFLYCLICSYPNSLSLDFIHKFIENDLSIGSNFYLSKTKNYFINKLDRQIQSILGIKTKKINDFKKSDRLFFCFSRGESVTFKKEISVVKISHKDHLGLMFLSFYIYDKNNIKLSKEISSIAYKNFHLKNDNKRLVIKDYFDINTETINLDKKIFDLQSIKERKISLLSEKLTLLIKSLLFIENNSKTTDSYISESLRNKFIYIDIIEIQKDLNNSIEDLLNHFKMKRSEELKKINICFQSINSNLSKLDLINNPLVDNQLSKIIEMINCILVDTRTNNKDNSTYTSNNLLLKSNFFNKFYTNFDHKPCEQPNWGDFIKSYDEILQIKSNAREVWIITSNFSNKFYTKDSEYLKIIENNLKNKISYKYFYPPEAEMIAKKFKKIYVDFPNVQFYKVDDLSNTFNYLCHDVILIDPNTTTSIFHSGFYIDFFKSINEDISSVHMQIYYKTLFNLVDFFNDILND